MNQKKIIITGGTGLIGSRLIPMLRERGYQVGVLSRGTQPVKGAKVWKWNPAAGEVDHDALRDVYAVIHLAGASVGGQRWTPRRKQEITESRVKPVEVLAREFAKTGSWPAVFLSASGISLYDQTNFEARFTENSPPSDHFLAEVVTKWEQAADIFSDKGARVVKFRTGIVLDSQAGALPKMATPVKLALGCPLGSGRQWISWIHIEDIARLYCEALDNTAFQGAYHAVAPEALNNRDFTAALCRALHRPFWPVHVPAFLLKTALGEMSSLVLDGAYCVNERIRSETNFGYRFSDLPSALTDLYN